MNIYKIKKNRYTNSRSDRRRDICNNRHDGIEVEKHEDLQKRVSSSKGIRSLQVWNTYSCNKVYQKSKKAIGE